MALLVMSNDMIQSGGNEIQIFFRKNKRFTPPGIEPGSLGTGVIYWRINPQDQGPPLDDPNVYYSDILILFFVQI